MTQVSCHLILRAERTHSGNVKRVKVVGSRVGRPALAHDEATIKIKLDVPDSLFDAEAVALVVEPREAILAVAQEPAA